MSAITAKESRKMKKYAVLTREPRCFLGSFDFSWEQRKLGDVVQITMGQSPDGSTYSDEPSDYILVQGNADLQNGWVCPRVWTTQITKKADAGDLIMSVRAPAGAMGKTAYNAVIGRGVAAIKGNEFIYQLLVKMDVDGFWKTLSCGSTFESLNSDNIKNAEVKIPTTAEQIKIGGYFQQLDNLITLHQRKYADLCSPSQVVFSLLFATSTFSWEQRKFDEVFDCTVPNNTLSRAELSYDEGTVLNVHYGDVLIKYGSVLDVQKDDIPRIPHRCREDFNGALLQDGDVIIADTAEDETTGKACEIGNLQGSAIVSGLHTMVCRPRNRMALGYLGYYLNSNAYHHQLLPLMQGIKVLSLSRSNIQKTSVSYPIAVKEQQLIAYYFSQLDNLITLHQRECISFTGKSVGLIQAINKKQITSSWEQRKLSELTSMHARIGWQNLRTSEFLDSGDYMLITGTDFNDGAINFSTCHYVERERYEQDRNIQIRNGSILITKDGTLGKVAYVQRLSMPATLNAGVFNVQIKDANNVDEKYLFQYLKAPFLMDYVDKKATGGTIKHLNQSILVDFPVILPRRSEQILIGAFFQQLDNLITLHQRKPFLMKWRTSDANRNQTNRLVL